MTDRGDNLTNRASTKEEKIQNEGPQSPGWSLEARRTFAQRLPPLFQYQIATQRVR